ncbi:DUF5793 family protein [Halodesulfurarchaeum sp.]|uniref:DUF5793 family protein n=1 Tax=Halodesulfurarchaeum sp. TaxID=1980530 RepID=UPI001BC7530D|nr:hypothetical protein [Halodesulfurarchaeum sp.]
MNPNAHGMRREEFSFETRHVRPETGETTAPLPTLKLQYAGPEGELRAALAQTDVSTQGKADLDVSLRLKGNFEEPDPDGVLAVTGRLTGDFICECNVPAKQIFEFLSATKRRAAAVDRRPKYRFQLYADDRPIRTEEMDTFLVYTKSGVLREAESLLPNGVQL